jgi:hypothetical protein
MKKERKILSQKAPKIKNPSLFAPYTLNSKQGCDPIIRFEM